MRINNEFRKCVAFVGILAQGRFTPLGTGFLCGLERDGYRFVWVATAAHVVDQTWGNDVAIRLNTVGGGTTVYSVAKAVMFRHPAAENDVILIPILIRPEIEYAMLALDRAQLIEARRDFWDIDLGDEVCAIGLYTSHHGAERNIPIIRIGNVASLLEEKVRCQEGDYVEAYLIELKTIAGLSGSIVFIVPPPTIFRDGQVLHRQGDMPPLPLGMLIGYHVLESREDQIPVPRFPADDLEDGQHRPQGELNTGFGIVVPIERIIDVVESAQVTDWIGLQVEAARAAGIPAN